MNLHKAYYWKGGVTPGKRGSALIAAHSYARGSAEYNPLWRVHRGNLVKIGTHTFKVTKVITRAPLRTSEKREAQLRSRLGHSRVVFTTCNAHTYNFKTSKYRHRVYVSAKKIN